MGTHSPSVARQGANEAVLAAAAATLGGAEAADPAADLPTIPSSMDTSSGLLLEEKKKVRPPLGRLLFVQMGLCTVCAPCLILEAPKHAHLNVPVIQQSGPSQGVSLRQAVQLLLTEVSIKTSTALAVYHWACFSCLLVTSPF